MLFFLSKIFKSNTIKTSILQLIQPDILTLIKLYQSLKDSANLHKHYIHIIKVTFVSFGSIITGSKLYTLRYAGSTKL